MKRIRLLPEASDDLLKALTWYRGQSLELAGRFYAEFKAGLRRIQSHPKLYSKRDALFRRANLHGFPYHIVYYELKMTVQVIAVAHASRRPAYWQGRTPEV